MKLLVMLMPEMSINISKNIIKYTIYKTNYSLRRQKQFFWGEVEGEGEQNLPVCFFICPYTTGLVGNFHVINYFLN